MDVPIRGDERVVSMSERSREIGSVPRRGRDDSSGIKCGVD